MDGYDFVAYANSNSIPFKEFYKIPEARTVVRGSLRYDENPKFIKAFTDIGWLDTIGKDWLIEGLTWLRYTGGLQALTTRAYLAIIYER